MAGHLDERYHIRYIHIKESSVSSRCAADFSGVSEGCKE